MHDGLTPAEAAEHAESLRLTDQLRAARQLGTLAEAAAAAGVSVAGASRWLARRDAFEAGEPRALLRGRSSGRPPQCRVSAEDARELRAAYLKSNRATLCGSKTGSARLLARSGLLSEEVAAAILKPRASKALPKVIKDAMHISSAVFAEHRSPKNARLDGFYIPGHLRMVKEAAGLRRLHAGERQSWDDATINFGVCVPWPWGGDPCADKFGVKLGRFQLLTCIDDAYDFCPGFSYVIREQQSYRAEDTVAAQFRLWRDTYQPVSAMLEGGAWQSQRALAFYAAARLQVCDATGRPHSKLVESWFNRLWTVLSQLPGQVGRYRAEMEKGNQLYLAARQGRVDPREHFPELPAALRDADLAIGHLNAEPVESKKYGRWVPQAAHRAGLEQNPRPQIDQQLFYHAAPIIERRLVRRNMVGIKCPSPWGESFPYHFASDALWDFEGCYVKVYFDPYDSPLCATLVLDQEHRGLKAGHVISRRAPVLEDAPEVLQVLEGVTTELNGAGLDRAIKMRKQIHAAIRTEYRALGFGGRQVASASEARDGRGQRARVEISSNSIDSRPSTLSTTLTDARSNPPQIPSGRLVTDPEAHNHPRVGQPLPAGGARPVFPRPTSEDGARHSQLLSSAAHARGEPVEAAGRKLPRIRNRMELANV